MAEGEEKKDSSEKKEEKKEKIVVATSGYFDPLHHGHVELFKLAKELGDHLIVIVNNDNQAIQKKGYVFMPHEEKVKIIESIKYVDEVIVSIDEDQTQCKTLEMLKPHIFAKGGDRYIGEIPETPVCKKHNIKVIDGLGAKVQSSSDLVKKARESENKSKKK
jgi:cytidyltransferase-like protein